MMNIPEYTIHRKLGEGGSRIAYLATRRFCKDPSVLKVFKTGQVHERIADQRGRHSLVEVLEREVEVLRRFSHPNLIRIFNHGEAESTFFIEEEYMLGGTIQKNLDGLQEEEAVELFRQIASGVRFLHNQGIIVRDLKLNNILLDEEKEVAKLDDLELCSTTGAAFVTRGSDKYTSPELFTGQATVQTDIYALGACLYYMLAGEVGGLTTINRLAGIQYDKELEAKLAQVPWHARDILKGCLAHDPKDRFSSALEVLNLVTSHSALDVERFSDRVVAKDREYFETEVDGRTHLLRDANHSDLKSLIKVYSRFWQNHNILGKEGDRKYTLLSSTKLKLSGGGYIVAVSDDEVVGGILVRPHDYDPNGGHVRVNYNHLVVGDSSVEPEVTGLLLEAAERKVTNFMKLNGISTGKIETRLAPDERRALQTYLGHGFKQEGLITDHYRHGEDVLFLGRSL